MDTVAFSSLTNDLEVGDYVERDEEIATIETDKARHLARLFLPTTDFDL
jgi:hypothetical protein